MLPLPLRMENSMRQTSQNGSSDPSPSPSSTTARSSSSSSTTRRKSQQLGEPHLRATAPKFSSNPGVWINGSPKPLSEHSSPPSSSRTWQAAWQQQFLPFLVGCFYKLTIFGNHFVWSLLCSEQICEQFVKMVRSLTRRSLPRGLRVSELDQQPPKLLPPQK